MVFEWEGERERERTDGREGERDDGVTSCSWYFSRLNLDLYQGELLDRFASQDVMEGVLELEWEGERERAGGMGGEKERWSVVLSSIKCLGCVDSWCTQL